MQDYLPSFQTTYSYSEMCNGDGNNPTAAVHLQVIIGESPTSNPVTITYTVYDNDQTYIPETTVTPALSGQPEVRWFTFGSLPTGSRVWVDWTISDSQGHSQVYGTTLNTVCTPIKIGDIQWNEQRTKFTIPVESPIHSDEGEGMAFASYDRFLTADELRQWGGQARTISQVSLHRWQEPPYKGTLTNGNQPVDISEGQRIYVTAGFFTWSPEGEMIMPESMAYKSFEVKKPILGLVDPGCENTKNIVDIVERKPDGTITPKGISGKRVALVEPCDGEVEYGAIHYKDENGYRQVYYCNSVADFNNLADDSYGDTQLNFDSAVINKSSILGVVVGTEITELMDYTFCRMQNLIAVQFAPGSKLVSIGNYCLAWCDNYHSRVDIPQGVISIGSSSLRQLNNVTAVTIPDTVTNIGDNFLYMSLSGVTKESVVFPASVSSLGDSVMMYNPDFNQPVTLPAGLVSTPTGFMSNCTAFNSPLILPQNLQYIYDEFMIGCESFNQPITMPDTVTYIGNHVLQNMSKFNAPLHISNALEYIGDYFLASAKKFNQPITIPAGVTSIGGNFMMDTPAMKSTVTIAGDVTPPCQRHQWEDNYTFLNTSPWTGEAPDPIVSPDSDGIHLAGPGAWKWKLLLPNRYNVYHRPYDSSNTRNLIFDGEYPSDMPYMFLNMNGYWQEITTVEEVEDFVNSGWYYWGPGRMLYEVIFTPRVSEIESITSFPPYFLGGCEYMGVVSGLDNFTHLETINYGFLQNASRYSFFLSFKNGEWTMPETLTTISDMFMYSNHPAGVGIKLNLPSSLQHLGDMFLAYCDYNAPLSIPDTVTYLGSGLLRNASNFNQPVKLPNNSQCIGSPWDSQGTQILYQCSMFNQPLEIPDQWTFIPDMFLGSNPYDYGWHSFFDHPIVIPEGVTRIGNYCFNMMPSFKQPLTLPAACTEIGYGFLYNCTNFTGPLKIESSWVSVEDSYFTLANSNCDEAAWKQGVTVNGPGATSLGNQLQNQSQADGYQYCRKLNIVRPTGTSGPATITGIYDSSSGSFNLNIKFYPSGDVAEGQWTYDLGLPPDAGAIVAVTQLEDGWEFSPQCANTWEKVSWHPEDEGDEMMLLEISSVMNPTCKLIVLATVDNKLIVRYNSAESTEYTTQIIQMEPAYT